MVRVFTNGPETRVLSYQRFKKWYLMPPSLTLSIIKYGSKVKRGNPGKGVASSPTPWCDSYRKGSLWVTLNSSRQLYLHSLLLIGSICTMKEVIFSLNFMPFFFLYLLWRYQKLVSQQRCISRNNLAEAIWVKPFSLLSRCIWLMLFFKFANI